MKAYSYTADTKEFYAVEEARLSPLEKGVYLIPANATIIKPAATKSGFTQCFNIDKQKWEYVEDNRDKTAYSKTTKEELKIDYLGKIKDEHTLLVPKQFDKWSEDAQSWIEDEALKKEYENQEKLKEINSLKQYLKNTDFYYVRLAETGEAVPIDVVEKRLETRAKIRELEDN
ncbi:hypothetical protein [Aliarcobacter butzleri]|uniref:hypothetical protein n=1 Tax=Aliarcobacter butzleri TaxID=28197 RepID=UPI001EDA4858|nr:hypothetical protein [Aliarcobacter butzleri]MCG3675579.1 hypothetical protein [Aliarcobacter butzleri]